MSSAFNRLLILRPDNLGDLVLFTGALRHIRRKWGDAEITLCVRRYGLGLFGACPYVDKLLVYETLHERLAEEGRLRWMPQIRGADRIGNWLRLVNRAVARRLYATDIAILPVLSPCADYHRTMLALSAKKKIGVCGNLIKQTVECDRNSRCWYSSQMDATSLAGDFPELEGNTLFLQHLGISCTVEDLWPEFWTSENDRRTVSGWLAASADQNIIGVVPGFSNSKKYLPPEWFAQVLSEGLDGIRAKIVLLGSTADVPICSAVADAVRTSGKGGEVLNLAGKSSISELVECVKRCNGLLCQDSATLHIAVGLRKPVIGIMGGGQYGRFYPWGESNLSRVVGKKMDCYGCAWRCIFETVRCIQEIPPETAISELRALIHNMRPPLA